MVQAEEFGQRVEKMSAVNSPKLTPGRAEQARKLLDSMQRRQRRNSDGEQLQGKSLADELREVGESPKKRSGSVEPEKSKKIDERKEQRDETAQRLEKPREKWTLRDVDDAIRDQLIGKKDVLCFPGIDASNIYDLAVKRSSDEDVAKFLSIIPNGKQALVAGIEFQLKSMKSSVKHPTNMLVLTAMEFIKYQIIDWELACLFNNDLPYYYRDGERISTFYSLMQEEVERLGQLSEKTQMYRFIKLQIHLNNTTGQSLVRFVSEQERPMEFWLIAKQFPHVPFFIPIGSLARGFPYSLEAMRAHEKKYGVVRQRTYTYETRMFQGPEFDAALDRNGLLSKGRKFTFIDVLMNEEFVKTKPKPKTVPSGGATATGGGGDGDGDGDDDPGEGTSGGFSGLFGGRGSGKKSGGASGGAGAGGSGGAGGGRQPPRGGGDPNDPDDPDDDDESTDTDDDEVDPNKKKKETQEERMRRMFARNINLDKTNVSMRDDIGGDTTYRRKSRREKDREAANRIEAEFRRIEDETRNDADDHGRNARMAAFLASLAGQVLHPRTGGDKDVKRNPRRDASGYRIRDYEYNLNGTTPEEILGEKFREAEFDSAVEQQIAAKEIFRAVLRRPDCPAVARDIAMDQLENYNPAAVYQQTLMMASARGRAGMNSVLLDDVDDANLVPPPIFGNGSQTDRVIKNLLTTFGGKMLKLTPHDGSKPIGHAFPVVRDALTSHGLKVESAFTVMEGISAGRLYEQIRSHKLRAGGRTLEERFVHMWRHLQVISKTSISPEYSEKELQRITSLPPKNICDALTKIQHCVEEMFDDELPERKTVLVQQKVVSTYYGWVREHFPDYYSQIETTYETEKLQDSAMKKTAAIQGITYYGTFDPIDTFIEVILRYMNRQKNLHRDFPKRDDGKKIRVNAGEVHLEGATGGAPMQPGGKKPKKKKVAKASVTLEDVQNLMDQKFSILAQNMQIQQPGPAYAVPQAPHQQQYNQPSSEKKVVKGPCYLCGKTGHAYTTCYTYKGMVPGTVTCQRCGGRHTSQCNTRLNKPSEQGGRQSQGNSNSQSQQPPNSANNSGGQQQFQMGNRLGNGGRQAHPAN